MLRVDITPFDTGIHHIELTPSPEDIELDPDTFRDILVEARLDCHKDRILIAFDVSATAQLTCDRTLKPYEESLVGEYSVLFAPPPMAGQEGGEDDPYGEVLPLEPGDREIDLTTPVRDTLLLAVPQRQIAPGAEEEDITTQFGDAETDDAIDPRWQKLRELQSGD